MNKENTQTRVRCMGLGWANLLVSVFLSFSFLNLKFSSPTFHTILKEEGLIKIYQHLRAKFS